MIGHTRSRLVAVGLCFVLIVAVGGQSSLADEYVVNVNARTNSGHDMYAIAVRIPVAAGTWQATLRDDPTNQYDGWSPWSSDGDPAAEGRPWRWAVQIDVPGQFSTNGYWAPNDGSYFPTQQQALAANLGGSALLITLSSPGTMYFWLHDGLPWDNRGGVSVILSGGSNQPTVMITNDYTPPAYQEYDYGLKVNDISFSDSTPVHGQAVTVTANVHNYALCYVHSGYGWYSSTGRSCCAEWDFYYPTTETVDIVFRCHDDVTVDWRVELDGTHITNVSVPGVGAGTHWKLVTVHNVPITAGPHTLFLGTYQMDLYPDLHLDWVRIGTVHREAESYDRMGGNDPAPDWRGVTIRPRGAAPDRPPLSVQVWDGSPDAGGVLICEGFVGLTNWVMDLDSQYPGTAYEAHYIPNGSRAELVCDWTATAGTHEIYVVVDPHNVLAETNEINNTIHITLDVGGEIPAIVDLRPDVLNPKDHGRWVTCYIELPAPYDVSQIEVASVRLNSTVAGEPWPWSVGDYDNDGVTDLMIKFGRHQVLAILPPGDSEVRVSGQVGNDTFAGTDTIKVLPQ